MMLGRPDASTDVSTHGNTMLVITISLRSLHGSGGALLSVFALVLAKSLSPALGSPVKDVLSVTLDDLAHLLTLVVASSNLNLVIFPQWHGPHPILSSELFRKGGRHQTASDMRRGTEVSFAALGSVGGNVFVKFHFLTRKISLVEVNQAIL